MQPLPTPKESPGERVGPLCRVVMWLASLPSPKPRAKPLPGRRRVHGLWEVGRPVLFLCLLCLTAGIPLAAVSAILGLVFFTAGAAALGLLLWMTEVPAEG